MHQRKSKKILIYFFLLIVVSSISNYSFNNFKFNQVTNIIISGLDQKSNQILSNKIINSIKENIFFLNPNEITKLLIKKSLIFTRSVLLNKFFIPNNLIFPKSRVILENYFN